MRKLNILSNTMNLIPKRIDIAIRSQDSLSHSKDSAYLFAKGYIKNIRDTTGIDDGDDDEEITKANKETIDNSNKDQPNKEIAVIITWQKISSAGHFLRG